MTIAKAFRSYDHNLLYSVQYTYVCFQFRGHGRATPYFLVQTVKLVSRHPSPVTLHAVYPNICLISCWAWSALTAFSTTRLQAASWATFVKQYILYVLCAPENSRVRFMAIPASCTYGILSPLAGSTQAEVQFAHQTATILRVPWVISVGSTTSYRPEIAASLSGDCFKYSNTFECPSTPSNRP